MRVLSNLLGTALDIFRIKRAVFNSSALTADRTITIPDQNVTLGSVVDGDKGEITVSGGTWTIDNGVVTTTKMGGDVTTAGKALLDDADNTAQRTTLGLGSIATQAASNVSITGGSITGITDLAVADGGTGASDASTARTNLGLVIGTNVQAQDAELQAIAGLTSAADRLPYFTGSGTAALATFTTFGRSLVDDADAAAAQSTLGLVIGTNVQAFDAGLQSIAGLTTLADRMIYTTASDTYAVTTLTAFGRSLIDDADNTAARTTLGLGTIATQAANSVSITGGSITGITDLAVADGGTGASDASGARTNLGLVIGTNVQAFDAELAAIAGLTSAADRLPYFTGSGTAALATFTAFGRSLVDDADAAAAQTTLGLVIGTNVQAYDAGLQSIAGLTTAADRYIYTTASDTYTVGTITAFGRSILDDADAAAGRTTLGATTVGSAFFTVSNPSAIRFPRVNADNTVTLLSDTDFKTALSISGGGSKTLSRFRARDNYPPASGFMTLNTRNGILVLEADDATIESAVFIDVMPDGADLSSGIKARIHWMAATATTNNVRWGVSYERSNTDLDSDSFDTEAQANGAANGTSGIVTVTEITTTSIDSIAVGDLFRLRVRRIGNDGTNDTMSGFAQILLVELQSAA